MTSKTKALFLGAAFVLTAAGLAQAAITVADVLPTYQDGSYSAVEVRETTDQIVVEATKNGVRTKTVYDKTSGAILSSQDHSANTSGAMGGSDDDSLSGDDDHGDDHSGSHDSGSDHSDSHDSGSDHSGGSDHDSGSDHSGSDHDGGSDHD